MKVTEHHAKKHPSELKRDRNPRSGSVSSHPSIQVLDIVFVGKSQDSQVPADRFRAYILIASDLYLWVCFTSFSDMPAGIVLAKAFCLKVSRSSFFFGFIMGKMSRVD